MSTAENVLQTGRDAASTASTQTDEVHRQLRLEIIRCRLIPGEYVTEMGLTKTLGVGKAPVRAALQRLREEGLILSFPRRGYQISPLTIRGAKNIMEMRLLLEPYAASVASGKLSDEAVDLFRMTIRLFDRRDDESVDRYIDCHRKAKLAIAEASGNTRLIAAIAQHLDEFERYSRLSIALVEREAQMRECGHNYLEALLSGDSEAAREQSRFQLEQTRDAVLLALQQRAHEFANDVPL